MSNLTLVIGNKNYSSWSLRPWLLLKHLGVRFEEIRIPLYRPETRSNALIYSPSGHVPVLVVGDLRVWDSLAICEYLAERFSDTPVWPREAEARVLARCISNEMHSGFDALRHELPMNCRGPRRGVVPSPQAQGDIDRIVAIWSDCREHFGSGGPWLFGAFSAADAMFAPVAIRFWAYSVQVPPSCEDYVETVLTDPPVSDWMEAGRKEPEEYPAMDRGAPQ